MQQLAYAQRSRFTAPILAALRELEEGPWTVQFVEARDGYDGTVDIVIPGETPQNFSADWGGSDPTRFPARLWAAATALHEAGLSGHFRLTHQAGTLTIERLRLA